MSMELKNGNILFSFEDGFIDIWNIISDSTVTIDMSNDKLFGLYELNNGNILLYSGEKISCWSNAGALISAFQSNLKSIDDVIELRNGDILATSEKGIFTLFDSNFVVLAQFYGHKQNIYDISELEDGKILSISGDQTLRIWERNGSLVQTLYITKELSRIIPDVENESTILQVISNVTNIYDVQKGCISTIIK